MNRPLVLVLISAAAFSGCAGTGHTRALSERVDSGIYSGEDRPGFQIIRSEAVSRVDLDVAPLQSGERLAIIYAGPYPNGGYRLEVNVTRDGEIARIRCEVDLSSERQGGAYTQAIVSPWAAYRLPASVSDVRIDSCTPYQGWSR